QTVHQRCDGTFYQTPESASQLVYLTAAYKTNAKGVSTAELRSFDQFGNQRSDLSLNGIPSGLFQGNVYSTLNSALGAHDALIVSSSGDFAAWVVAVSGGLVLVLEDGRQFGLPASDGPLLPAGLNLLASPTNQGLGLEPVQFVNPLTLRYRSQSVNG